MRKVITKEVEASFAARKTELTPNVIASVVEGLLPAIHKHAMATVRQHHAADTLARVGE